MNNKWKRRDLLRNMGLSALVAPILPYWDDIATAQQLNKKYLVLAYFPNGKDIVNTFVTRSGNSWNYGQAWKPLDPFKNDSIVFENYGFDSIRHSPLLSKTKDAGGVVHMKLTLGMFTGSADLEHFAQEPSIDQIIAHEYLRRGIIKDPLRKTLPIQMYGYAQLNTYPFAQVPADYQVNQTYNGSRKMQFVNSILRPIDGFKRMFGDVAAGSGQTIDALWAARKSIVDNLHKESKSIRDLLPSDGRQTMEKHLSVLRELEISLNADAEEAPQQNELPSVDQSVSVVSIDKTFDQWANVVDAAFRFDRTRIATFSFSGAGGGLKLPSLNLPKVGGSDVVAGNTHHAYSHHNPKGMERFWTFYNQKMAQLASKLRGDNGNRNILNDSLIMMGTEGGRLHRGLDVPVVMIGSAGGSLKTNQIVKCDNGQETNAHMHNRTLLTVCHAMGVTNLNHVGHRIYANQSPVSAIMA